eukprot:m51a1_g12501 hypothetical protein (117) ;mRNA; r:287-692
MGIAAKVAAVQAVRAVFDYYYELYVIAGRAVSGEPPHRPQLLVPPEYFVHWWKRGNDNRTRSMEPNTDPLIGHLVQLQDALAEVADDWCTKYSGDQKPRSIWMPAAASSSRDDRSS